MSGESTRPGGRLAWSADGRSVWELAPVNRDRRLSNGPEGEQTMFVQVINGRTSDPQALQAAMDTWVRELSPGADGWLGSTGGVTDDGRFIAVVRFDSEEEARRNSDRPEQGQWWAETSKHFDGEPEFHDSVWVLPDVVGDPAQAGFVQVMQGHSNDPDRARELFDQEPSDEFRAFRPDILGSLAVAHDAGFWTMAIWFTSEADARVGEKKEPTPEIAAQMEEMNKISEGVPEFFDLPRPWMYAPA
jgi:hypothetical protein